MPIPFLLLGSFALSRGIRGVRIGDHPHCARCKFDLLGLDQAEVCPECGASLIEPGARTVGIVHRSPTLIVTGGVLLAFFLLMSWGITGSAGWYPNAPLWILERQAMSEPESQGAMHARQEILDRARLGTISPERLHEFVLSSLPGAQKSNVVQQELMPFLSLKLAPRTLDAFRAWAFEVHADRSMFMSMALAEYLNTEFWSGRLDAKEMEQYLRAGSRPELSIGGPASCAPGESLPVMLIWNWRGGATEVASTIDFPEVSFKEHHAIEEGLETDFGPLRYRLGTHVASLVPGTHEVKGTATIQLKGRVFSLYASRTATMAGYPGGSQNIPPISISFPVSATYFVDSILSDPSADPDRRAIMRSISIHVANSPVHMGLGGEVPMLFVTVAPQYSAEADLTWSDGKTLQSFGHARISLQDTGCELQFDTESGSYRGGGGQNHFYVLALGNQGPPAQRPILRAHFHNIELRPKGGTPTPIEPFDLEFTMSPAK